MQDRPFPFRRCRASIATVTEGEFGIAVMRHRRELHRHCARLLRSRLEAEDALQETFLRAWRSLDTCRDRAAARGWLYRIASNVCIDALAKRRPVLLERPPEPTAPAHEQPDAVAMANETVALALLAAVQCLPPRQRACLVMCDMLRWSVEDAAAALSATVPAANSLLQRARSGLRAHLAADRLEWVAR